MRINKCTSNGELEETEIGTIAKEWRIASLEKVCEPPQYGFTASAAEKGGIRLLRITDITDSGVVWPTVPFCECPSKFLDKFRLANGDIVFARIGATTGKSYLIANPPDAVFASYLIRVRPKQEVDSAFLSQFFKSAGYWQQVDAQKHANLKKGVSGSLLKTLLIPVPPLAEQRKIAAVLGLVQRAIEQQERLLALTAELKKALLHQLFTRGLRHEPQKQTELGPIPQNWEAVPLISVLSAGLQNGAFARRKQFGSGHLFANVVDMYRETHLDPSRLERVRFDLSDVKQYLLHKGDVLVVRSSLKREGIGQNCVVGDLPEPAIYDCHLIRVIPDQSKLVSEFLSAFWRSPVGKLDLVQRSKTVTMTTINQAGISGALVPLAPMNEQQEIVNVLTQMEAKERVHSRKHAALNALFRTLLHELMTARIRVHNLDLRDMQ